MKTAGRTAFAIALLFGAPFALAAELVNINTASLSELDSLPEIGPALAQRIVDYRSGPDGPFDTKEEILNVSGIGPATYNAIKDLITVGGGAAPVDTEEEEGSEESASSTEVQTSTKNSSGSAKKTPLDEVRISTSGAVVAKAPARFSAHATDEKGLPLYFGVRYAWNFGDGTTGSEREPVHTYAYPGTYVVSVTVKYNEREASVQATIKVLSSGITLTLPGDGSVAVANNTGEELDISGWMFTDLAGVFVVPQATRLPKGGESRFSPAVTGIAASSAARLLFPNGEVAASVLVPEVKTQRPAGGTSGLVKNTAEAPARPGENLPQPLTASAIASGQALPMGVLPWAGLGAVLVSGMAGAYYAGRRGETKSLADTFEIE